jgi:hypothetical protein
MLCQAPYKLISTMWRIRIPIAIVAVGCAVLIAACGSSRKPSAAGNRSQFLAFSACMRSHGVPNFPDPSASGGIQLNQSSGINPFSPSFKSAQGRCSKLLPGGGPANQKPSEQDKQQMLRVSQCMRAHGVTAFPDPTLTPPSSPAGYSEVIDRGGVVVAVPNTIDPRSPVYQHAAAVCGFPH